ncbi:MULTISPECIES: S8/S53 family peptidase [Pseudomonas]|uniref:S8/S53 family peptidase n=1 Tax=Pseudomonas TaxID=286 RepID=UPI000BA41428|nr:MULTISPECIES: S8/S53 family peptidase [Pseudomonas]MDR9865297.1 S8/S53 family peptidase [Pseudomonas baetica]
MNPLWLLSLPLGAVMAAEPDLPLVPPPDPSAFEQMRKEIAEAPSSQSNLPTQIDSGVLVSFEGGNVGQHVAKIMLDLGKEDRLPSELYKVQAGDTLCGLLDKRGYPPPCPPMLEVVRQLNPNRPTTQQLKIGEAINLPTLATWPAIASKRVAAAGPLTRDNCTPASDALFKYWSNLEPRVVNCIPGAAEHPPSSVVQYRAYQFVVPTDTDETSLKIRAQLENSKSANVYFDVIPHETDNGSRLYAENALTADTCPKGLSDEKPIDYLNQFDYDRDALTAVRDSMYPGGAKRDIRVVPVYLIDTPLDPSPNLFPAYVKTKPTKALSCQWASPFSNRFHGTHLAGLIGSQGYGFRSISTNAAIFSFVWNKVRDDDQLDPVPDRNVQLQQQILGDADAPRGMTRAIYVAATKFTFKTLRPLGERLGNSEYRWQEAILKAVKNSRSLFIVSAGQTATEQEQPSELANISSNAPQNLGDLPNVIVVTACTSCGRNNARLMPSANFGSGPSPIVQLAAPGGQSIPGWVTTDRISSASGTSQATALIASVAAAMRGAWPEAYLEPVAIKVRLQVTSRPMSRNPDGSANPDGTKIAAGVADPVLAMLDPERHWLKEGGQWRAVKIRGIQTPTIFFADPSGNRDQASRNALKRVLTLSDGSQMAYAYDLLNGVGDPGVVRRIGPTQVAEGELTLCDRDDPIPLADIQDIIFSPRGIEKNECL